MDTHISRLFCIAVAVTDETPRRVSGVFSQAEAATLEQYVEHALELFATKAVRDGLPCSLSFRFDPTALGGGIQIHVPDDDAMAVVLHRLRPLILQREAASFINVAAILGKHLADSSIRIVMREQRELYDNSDRAQTFAMNLNNSRLNAENVLQDWLNGLEYHTDADRKARIQKLLDGAEVLVRYSLVSMLLNKIDAIRAVLELTRTVLGLRKGVRFESHPSGRPLVVVEQCEQSGVGSAPPNSA